MAQNFIECGREQQFLLAPDLRDWLPAGHLARFVIEAVDELDLVSFYADYRDDGWGRAAFEPSMMVALLVYAYAVGERSARGIERRCVEDIAFRVIAADQAPDHATIARFRVRHEAAISGLFTEVLALCAEAGLVSVGVVALDSTKIAANASGQANRSYEQIAREILAEAGAVDRAEDELYGDRRGDELPDELADPVTRKVRLKEAKRRLEERRAAEQAKVDARAEREAELAQVGRKIAGRKPQPRDPNAPPRGRVNVTDPDSRSVKTPRGFIQGYNAQAVATEGQIVVAAELTEGSSDGGQLQPMLETARDELAAAGITQHPAAAVADSGYWSSSQVRALTQTGIRVLVPPDGHTGNRRKDQRLGGLYDQMRADLASEQGSGLYRRRQQIIEPIFGHTKFNRKADRFQRRGTAACRSEWRLITATHNLLKLWRATTPQTA